MAGFGARDSLRSALRPQAAAARHAANRGFLLVPFPEERSDEAEMELAEMQLEGMAEAQSGSPQELERSLSPDQVGSVLPEQVQRQLSPDDECVYADRLGLQSIGTRASGQSVRFRETEASGTSVHHESSLSTFTVQRSRRIDGLTFEVENREMLRGASVSSVLAALLRTGETSRRKFDPVSQEDAEALWARSRPVPKLSYFLSHSWASSSYLKALTILLFFNGNAAALASLLVPILCLLGVFLGLLDSAENWEEQWPRSGLFSLLVFTAMLCWWHRIPAALSCRSSRVFFDRACIYQGEDSEWKATGIEHIAAFVKASDKMVVLWSPAYFGRLWCVVEVAALIRIHAQTALPKERLPLAFYPEFTAVDFLTIIVFMSTVQWTKFVFYFEFRYAGLLSYSVPIFMVCPIYIHALRGYMRERLALKEQLLTFKARNAECSNPTDFILLNHTISRWFGSLSSFDRYVKTAVAKQVLRATGSEWNAPLHMQIFVVLPVLWVWADRLPPDVKQRGLVNTLYFCASEIFQWLCLLDLVLLGAHIAPRSNEGLRLGMDALISSGVALAGSAVGALQREGLEFLACAACPSWMAAIAFLLSVCAFLFVRCIIPRVIAAS